MPAHVNRLPDAEPPARSFALVIADQVFPYLRHRCELDAIEALVMPHGLLGLQLPLPREVPAEQDAADPTWAQCAFYPWESLRRLMLQWEGQPSAGSWLLFKRNAGVSEAMTRINRREGDGFLRHADGFLSDTDVILPLDAHDGVLGSRAALPACRRPAALPRRLAAAPLPLSQAMAALDTPDEPG